MNPDEPVNRINALLGGKPTMWKTGHSLVKAKMKERHSPLAGEMSGHIFFGERWYGFDDAQYVGARLLETAEAVTLEHGYAALRLEVRQDNAAAQTLYRRAGYRERAPWQRPLA